jgi:putative DNA primase/helicase
MSPKKNNKVDNLHKADTILNHVEGLISQTKPTPHTELLDKLLEQIQPIDFKALVYPHVQQMKEQLKNMEADTQEAKAINKQLSKLKVVQKQYLVLCIDTVLELANSQRWGLCKHNEFIYLYNGTHWQKIEKDTLAKFLGEAAQKMGINKFDARFYQFRENLFKQFMAVAFLPPPKPSKEVIINLGNGTLEIGKEGVKLRNFKAADFLTYQLSFDYDESKKAPLFQKYLDTVLPDKNSQKVLAEYLGFIFTKRSSQTIKIEKALILHGNGANGKSVFFDIVDALIGKENISNASLQSLTDDKGYSRADLSNKLLNYASEINGKLEASIFKQLVSGEPVEARLPYGNPFTIRDYAKMIFNCNLLPTDVEHTNAFFRRFLIVPFDVTIPKEEQDDQLANKIISSELSGVFNWVLDGLYRLLEQRRFTESEAVNRTVEQYRIESDSVKLFLYENDYQVCTEGFITFKALFDEYKLFCIDSGCHWVKKSNFKKRLAANGFHVAKGTGNTNIVFIKQETAFTAQ